jgi:hypothetical protein
MVNATTLASCTSMYREMFNENVLNSGDVINRRTMNATV